MSVIINIISIENIIRARVKHALLYTYYLLLFLLEHVSLWNMQITFVYLLLIKTDVNQYNMAVGVFDQCVNIFEVEHLFPIEILAYIDLARIKNDSFCDLQISKKVL